MVKFTCLFHEDGQFHKVSVI